MIAMKSSRVVSLWFSTWYYFNRRVCSSQFVLTSPMHREKLPHAITRNGRSERMLLELSKTTGHDFIFLPLSLFFFYKILCEKH